MQDLVAGLEHGDHVRVLEPPHIEGLPTALGIERRLVEHHRRPPLVLASRHHAGLEVEQVWVVPVEEPCGHGDGAPYQRGAMFPTILAEAMPNSTVQHRSAVTGLSTGGAYPERHRFAPTVDTGWTPQAAHT